MSEPVTGILSFGVSSRSISSSGVGTEYMENVKRVLRNYLVFLKVALRKYLVFLKAERIP